MFRISNKNKRTIVFITYTKQKEYQNQTKTVARSLPNIGHRTQSDRTPNAIRSDTERNPIGHRTRTVIDIISLFDIYPLLSVHTLHTNE